MNEAGTYHAHARGAGPGRHLGENRTNGLGALFDLLAKPVAQLGAALVGPALLDLLRVQSALLRDGLVLRLGPLLRRPCPEQEALPRVVAALVTGIHDHRVVAGTRERVSRVLLLALRAVVEAPAVEHLALGVLCVCREPHTERGWPREVVSVDVRAERATALLAIPPAAGADQRQRQNPRNDHELDQSITVQVHPSLRTPFWHLRITT